MLAFAAAATLSLFGPRCDPAAIVADPASASVPWTATASRATGRPERGRLVDGVMLPSDGTSHITWDPATKSSPSPQWRRWGTDRLLRKLLCVTADYRRLHPDAPRLVIGDMSLPAGGPFGREHGGLGHLSHQNGLDVDVYYPRIDRRETAASAVADIDKARSQQLVDLFVQAGAVKIFVGRRTGITGPRSIVSFARHHDDHLHVRFAKTDPPAPVTPPAVPPPSTDPAPPLTQPPVSSPPSQPSP